MMATRWERVLVATDFSKPAESALRSAEALAAASGSTLRVVHVVEVPPPSVRSVLARGSYRQIEEAWTRQGRSRLDEVVEASRDRGSAAEGVVRIGAAADEILAEAGAGGVDVICLGASGHSTLERMLLGSTAEEVVRRARVPVLVVRDRPLGEIRRVLLPVDFDDRSEVAMRFAMEAFEDAEMLALHVVAPLPPADPVTGPLVPDLAEIHEEMEARLDPVAGGRVPLEVRLRVDPAGAILERAREYDADLVVLATHGRRGLRRLFLGSVAGKVVRHIDRPVLVLPAGGAEGSDGGAGEPS